MNPLLLALLLAFPAAVSAQVIAPPDSEPDRSAVPTPGPSRPFGIPALRRAELLNGLKLTATEIRGLPIVAVTLVLPGAGEASQPAGLAGVARLAASLFDEGTQARDGREFALALEELGASFSVSVAKDAAVVTVFAMKDSIDAAMALAAEALRRPAFAEPDLARMKLQMISSLKEASVDPEAAAGRRLSERVYGSHAYGAAPTPESLAAVGRTEVGAFHARAYAPAGASLHAVGDVDLEAVKAMAESHFGSWNAAAPPAAPAGVMLPTPDAGAVAEAPGTIDVIDMPGAPQSFILVGQTALPRGHADYYALRVLNAVLGGPSARIEAELRERLRIAYYARSQVSAQKQGGLLVLESPVETPRTAEAVRILLAEMRRLQTEDVPAAEIDGAKRQLAGRTLKSLGTVQSIAGLRADAELHGLGDAALSEGRDAVLAVTAADLRRVAGLYLRPDAAAIVLSGDAAKIVADLRAIAPVRVLDGDGKPRA